MITSKIKTIFHTVIFAYIYLILTLVVPTNFSVIAPFKTSSVTSLVSLNGIEQTDKLHIVSVLSMDRISYFARVIYELNPEMTVRAMNVYEQQLTPLESYTRSQLQKQSSYEQALVAAYTSANAVDDQITINYELIGMAIDYRNAKYTNLMIGDIIVDIDGNNFDTYAALGQYFISNTSMELSILRNGQVITTHIEKGEDVFSFYPRYSILHANPAFELPGNQVISGGPSGGMMYTLSLYLALTGYTKIDQIVAGTGTIRYDGSIGNIGGLRQKVYTAKHEGIKYFICPMAQYGEVVDLSNETFHIYPVSNMAQAVEVIHGIFD